MHNNILASTDWASMNNLSDLVSYLNQNNPYNFIIDNQLLLNMGFDLNNNQLHLLTNNTIDNLPISMYAKNYIIDVIVSIDSIGFSTDGNFNSVQGYVLNKENEVINNTLNFTQTEKDAILVFFAVLVRSNEYWNSDNDDVDLLRGKRGWNWWRTGICDGLGAVVGAIFAGPVVGALIGGVACSAGDALAQHNGWGTNLFNIFKW